MLTRGRTVLVAGLLFAAVTILRFAAGGDPADAVTVLYVVPVAVLALGFGLIGGLGGAALAAALTELWVYLDDVDLSATGHGTRVVSVAIVGALVGLLAQRWAAAEQQASRWFEMSNDMLCEATLDGYFTRLNDSWGETLGWSKAELMARPYAEFVDPDDLEPTSTVAGGLAEGPTDLKNFENRYRHKDGSRRWLLWSARSDGEKIYAVAKDITDRKRLESEREQLLARVEAMARTDELTGLPNRRAWNEELRRELARATREGREVCVALLDLDRFKQFNDEHGHQAGDDLLRDAAAAWRLVSRISDFAARYGGEEFAFLFFNCPLADATRLADRLRHATPGDATASVGIALWDGQETAEQLVARADAALYEAKHSGRDRAVIAT